MISQNFSRLFFDAILLIHKDISLHTVLWQTENLHSIPQLNFSITNFTKKKKESREIFVTPCFSVWTSQGLNLGPPDYE